LSGPLWSFLLHGCLTAYWLDGQTLHKLTFKVNSLFMLPDLLPEVWMSTIQQRGLTWVLPLDHQPVVIFLRLNPLVVFIIQRLSPLSLAS